jgi:hypothetical protein
MTNDIWCPVAGIACHTRTFPQCEEASRPLQGFNEALIVHWLEKVIQRFVAKCIHSIFFMSGEKNDHR